MAEESVAIAKTFNSWTCIKQAAGTVNKHWFALIVADYLKQLISLLAGLLILFICIDNKDWCLIQAFAGATFVYAAMQCGYLKFCLNLHDNDKVEWQKLFTGLSSAPDMFAATLCVLSGWILGFLLLVIPALMLTVRTSMFGLLLVDKKLDAEAALSTSNKMLKGYNWCVVGVILFTVLGRFIFQWWGVGFDALGIIALCIIYRHILSGDEAR